MRFSIVDGDPGQIPYANVRSRGEDIRVFLDGVEQRYCRTVDTDQGSIELYSGEQTSEEWLIETKFGAVTVEFYRRPDVA